MRCWVLKRPQSAKSQYRQKRMALNEKDPIPQTLVKKRQVTKWKIQKKIMQLLKILWNIKKKKVPMISNVYRKWKNLFQKKRLTRKLFKHQLWNHEIKLISKMKSTFGLLYTLSETELKKFRNYLNKELKKRIIRKSTSKTKYPILFTPKKNGKLRLCVDYWKVNDITIKNKYSLFNIKELQNRLQKTVIFFKLDLRWRYNLIKIKLKKMKNNFSNSIWILWIHSNVI